MPCAGCLNAAKRTAVGATKRLRAAVAPTATPEQAEARLRVCASCPSLDLERHGRGTATADCRECGCRLAQSDPRRGTVTLSGTPMRPTGKTKLIEEPCPLGRWEEATE